MKQMTRYILTHHAMQRYSERENFNHKRIKDDMMKDIRAVRNKRIDKVGDKRYVIMKNYRECDIQKVGNKEIVITIIKNKRDAKEKALEKRLREKEEYESIIRDFEVKKDDK